MELSAALAELETAGTEQNRKVYRRHGAREPLYGVSFATLRAMAKRAKRDQPLALGLWASGNYDARILACMVADPTSATERDLDAWLTEIDVYVLVDVFVVSLASQVPGVRDRADRWTASGRDWTSQAGWDLYAQLALHDADLDDAFFEALLERIEAGIGGAGNRTRHSMNGALIAIGARNERLRPEAEAAGERIGRVVVDHGQTGCVTPDAVPYIASIWDRRAARSAQEPVGVAV
jgi:3-methyladenine DNA glycosylase AlkD